MTISLTDFLYLLAQLFPRSCRKIVTFTLAIQHCRLEDFVALYGSRYAPEVRAGDDEKIEKKELISDGDEDRRTEVQGQGEN